LNGDTSDLGGTSPLRAGIWPRFAPQLGGSFRNIRFGIPSFDLGRLTNLVNLPVGYGGPSPILPTSTRLLELATAPVTAPETTLPPEIDRRDIPPLPQTRPDLVALSDKAWFERMNPGQTYVPPGAAPIVAPNSPVGASKSMDLGALITDLGSQYIQTRYAAPAQLAAPVFTPGAVATTGAAVGAAAGAMGVGLPFVDVIPGAPDSKCGGGKPVYKYHCGEYKWVYPKRRRRKALATQSDLRGLAALKGVLGQGKAFEVWIATHS
jgi:hypothetical protein